MKKTGEILKAAREAKGLSLNEVGLSLKIGSKVLKAIEDGDDSHLPAKTFLRGFVKSYATFLRLDADKVLEQFYAEMGSTRPQPYIRPETTSSQKETLTVSEVAPSATTEGDLSAEATVTPIRKEAATPPPRAGNYSPLQEKKNTKTVGVFVILAVLVGLILFTKRMIDKYSKEAEVPTAEVAQTIEGVTPVTPTAGETPAPVESMNPQASPAPSPLSGITTPTAEKTAPATMATPTPSATPTPTVTPKPTVTPTPTPSPIASATAAATPSPTPTPTPKEEKNKPVELIVEALDTVEIEYASPNGKPQKIKLSSEQVHTFKSKSGLKINFSNGGAVNLILNGKEIGIPGDLGKPIKLSY
ncbi:MAG: helix-turn-helix domain-containing protein [Bdellovibrio sp.]